MHRIWRKHRKYENYLFHPMDCCNYSWSGHWADQADPETAYQAGFMFGNLAVAFAYITLFA